MGFGDGRNMVYPMGCYESVYRFNSMELPEISQGDVEDLLAYIRKGRDIPVKLSGSNPRFPYYGRERGEC